MGLEFLQFTNTRTLICFLQFKYISSDPGLEGDPESFGAAVWIAHSTDSAIHGVDLFNYGVPRLLASDLLQFDIENFEKSCCAEEEIFVMKTKCRGGKP